MIVKISKNHYYGIIINRKNIYAMFFIDSESIITSTQLNN